MSTDINERLDRLQAEVSQLRELALMQVAVLQIIAIKQGIKPGEYQAACSIPIPTPTDIQGMLRAND